MDYLYCIISSFIAFPMVQFTVARKGSHSDTLNALILFWHENSSDFPSLVVSSKIVRITNGTIGYYPFLTQRQISEYGH